MTQPPFMATRIIQMMTSATHPETVATLSIVGIERPIIEILSSHVTEKPY
jgi:hypothetical protein